jgi:hypothetical protein
VWCEREREIDVIITFGRLATRGGLPTPLAAAEVSQPLSYPRFWKIYKKSPSSYLKFKKYNGVSAVYRGKEGGGAGAAGVSGVVY